MNDDGSMARFSHLLQFCRKHNLKMTSVAELIRYRMSHEQCLSRSAEGCIETDFGRFKTVSYNSEIESETHVALVRGEVSGKDSVLVHMHSRCTFGDAFGSLHCNCGRVMRDCLKRIAEENEGILLYLYETGASLRVGRHYAAKSPGGVNGIQIWTHNGHSHNVATETGIGGQILADLGMRKIRLLGDSRVNQTNFRAFGIEIIEHLPVAL
jgi:3,4-dihydroxy 2-butanone 4-phosphate synthase/GTP cyclohydrolase II